MDGTDWVITIAGIGWLSVFFMTFVFSVNAISWKLTESDRRVDLNDADLNNADLQEAALQKRDVDFISTFNAFPPYC